MYSRRGVVTVHAHISGKEFIVKVTDTGPGLSEEESRFIFDRFYRVNASRKDHPGGTGLGLAIAKEIVEYHGGRIGVDSEPGAGKDLLFHAPLMECIA
ncbi:cell wall metabolism sensor histidine kinase WalK [Paenibacillus sp. P25]|nr:cell wall metabolism sensor histidine kinase WalK [Paenibacillus sp. P25]